MDYLIESNEQDIIKKILVNYQTEYIKRAIVIEVLFSLIDKFDESINEEDL